MEVKWLVFLTFAGLGISLVAGNRCDTEAVLVCYSKLTDYEGIEFPLYGEDEQALDETCSSISESFDCLDDYLRNCSGKKECGDKCKAIINDIGMFSLNTGLRDLRSELCDPLSPFRLTYLDNYVCLEDNADQYAKCHNDSQLSHEYLNTITEAEEGLYARCCYMNWYEGCFTNITRENCNENATFFVSMSLHKLMGHIIAHLCQDSTVICSRPPLASDGKPIFKHNDAGDCTGEGCKIDLDVDNCVDDNCSSSSSFMMFSVTNLFISLNCIVLFKYLILIK